jgi:hypothetical protein
MFEKIRERQRTTREQMELAIDYGDLRVALFERGIANGDEPRMAAEKMFAAMRGTTTARSLRLIGIHYRLFRDEWGPLPDAEEQWVAELDEALRDAAVFIDSSEWSPGVRDDISSETIKTHFSASHLAAFRQKFFGAVV